MLRTHAQVSNAVACLCCLSVGPQQQAVTKRLMLCDLVHAFAAHENAHKLHYPSCCCIVD